MGRVIVRIRTLLLVCTAALALTSAAAAQSPGPAPAPAYGALPPVRIAAIVRAAGFDPLFRPMRQGDTYVLRALDRNEVEYRLVIDAFTGRTISIRATGEPGPYARVYRGGPAYGPAPMYGRVFGPDDDRYGPRYDAPRPPLPPQVRPPQTSKATPPVVPPAQTKPTQLATPEPNKTGETPLPRPRPYVMEATSSIPADAPKTAPQIAPPPPPAAAANPAPAAPSAPPANTPQDNGGASMPPITPLD
jgi:hypothetical protein